MTASTPLQAFKEESAIVMDKWLYDVCKEELQFPSHRRAQFEPYMARIRSVMSNKEFVAGTFVYPSRNGLREVAVVQNMLDCLSYEETLKLGECQQTDRMVEGMLKLLEDKTLGASPLLRKKSVQRTQDAPVHRDPTGYQPLHSVDSENYGLYLQMAERYISDIKAKGSTAASQRSKLKQEWSTLQNQKSNYERNIADLIEDMDNLKYKQEELQQKCQEEQQLLSDLQERWASLQADSHDNSAEERNRDQSGDHLAEEVAKKRAQLIDIGNRIQTFKHQMMNEEQQHKGKMRQAKQKLTEWEEVVEVVRKTHNQKRGQVKAISTVLQDTAKRIASTNNGSSLSEQLGRLNQLLYQRTAEYMAGNPDDTAAAADAALLTSSSQTGVQGIRPLQPSSILSHDDGNHNNGDTTPQRGGSYDRDAISPALSPTSGATGGSISASGGAGAPVRRSRYDIVSHLQKWERALLEERQRMHVAMRPNAIINDAAPSMESMSAHHRVQYNQLRKILFTQG